MKATLKIDKEKKIIELPISSDYNGETVRLIIGGKIIETNIPTTKKIVISGGNAIEREDGDYVIDFGNSDVVIDPDDIEYDEDDNETVNIIIKGDDTTVEDEDGDGDYTINVGDDSGITIDPDDIDEDD